MKDEWAEGLSGFLSGWYLIDSFFDSRVKRTEIFGQCLERNTASNIQVPMANVGHKDSDLVGHRDWNRYSPDKLF